jgi:hypothetical protein
VARYYTPSGRSIQAEGIAPDVVVENLNTDVLEKAMIKTQIKREGDIKGHLQNDNESFEEDEDDAMTANATEKAKSADKTKKATRAGKKNGMMQLWWGDEKPEVATTPKDKLLRDDFQALQAYNYLRAWKVMHGFDDQVEAVKADSTPPPEAKKKTN